MCTFFEVIHIPNLHFIFSLIINSLDEEVILLHTQGSLRAAYLHPHPHTPTQWKSNHVFNEMLDLKEEMKTGVVLHLCEEQWLNAGNDASREAMSRVLLGRRELLSELCCVFFFQWINHLVYTWSENFFLGWSSIFLSKAICRLCHMTKCLLAIQKSHKDVNSDVNF